MTWGSGVHRGEAHPSLSSRAQKLISEPGTGSKAQDNFVASKAMEKDDVGAVMKDTDWRGEWWGRKREI